MGSHLVKAKVLGTAEMIVTLRKYDNGEYELEEVEDVMEVEEFDNVRELG